MRRWLRWGAGLLVLLVAGWLAREGAPGTGLVEDVAAGREGLEERLGDVQRVLTQGVVTVDFEPR